MNLFISPENRPVTVYVEIYDNSGKLLDKGWEVRYNNTVSPLLKDYEEITHYLDKLLRSRHRKHYLSKGTSV